MLASAYALVLASGLIPGVAAGRSASVLEARDGPSPSLPYDPNTSSYCTWWADIRSATTCDTVISENYITLADFRRWNPSLPATCVLEIGKSYCVEAYSEPAPGPSTTSTTSTIPLTSSTLTSSTSTTLATTTTILSSSTVAAPATTTTSTNGIITPTPTQATIVDNCDEFYFVVAGDTCDNIVAKHGITLAQFLSWNPSVGSTCSGLWASAYACVSIVGHTPTKPTTTKDNGIATPTPIQPNMVNNCDLFYKVKSGDTCATIAASKGITVQQLTTWNPYVKSDCSLLWLDYYICISIVGHTPTPVNPPNGIQTPTPYQDGMTTTCKTFHFVQSGQTCQTITQRYGITQADFVRWNPAVRSDCTGMWANAYVCVAVL
ncbi:LysM domain-containing protein [Corynascus similis CBS 632.67]